MMFSPYLKVILKMVEERQWITPAMWEKIISNADAETLVYLREEAMPTWKLFIRDDWMEPAVKKRLFEMAGDRLVELRESAILHKFFDGVADFLL